jgi:beta-1,4-mannosyltransferase
MTPSRLRVLAWPMTSRPGENPYIDLLYGALRQRGAVELAPYTKMRLARCPWDIFHVHWPEWSLRSDRSIGRVWDTMQFLALLRQARVRGCRVVWTAHDLRPHDSSGRKDMARFMAAFSRQVDMVIGLSAASLSEVDAVYPQLGNVPRAVVAHGHYRHAYPACDLTREQARQAMGLVSTGRLLLFVGQVRDYKNVEALVASFRRVASAEDRLVVAGKALDPALAARIDQAAEGDSRVRLELRTIDDHEISLFLTASDVVLLPYRAILNSGTALLGLSFDRPVVVPAMGSLNELRDRLGPEWVRTYEGPFGDDVIAEALLSVRPTGHAPLDGLDWESVADETLKAYRAALDQPRPRHRRRSPARS